MATTSSWDLYWAALPSLYSSGFIRGNRKMLQERVHLFASPAKEYSSAQRLPYRAA